MALSRFYFLLLILAKYRAFCLDNNDNKWSNDEKIKKGCIAMVGGHGGPYIWEEVMLF